MSKITVVSLGPGSRDHLTLGALNALEKAEKVVLRTEKCDAAAYIREKGISFDTLDHLHEEADDFEELAENAAGVDTAEGESEYMQTQLRENLNETAFFYPALTTDEDGNVPVLPSILDFISKT